MNYWLIKSEPHEFSIDDMKKSGVDVWDGVRNYQARNNMKAMKKGDVCFFYHSNIKEPGIAGLVKVVEEAYPDPQDPRFVLVKVQYISHCDYVSLRDLKHMPQIAHLPLFHQSRLSVQPVDRVSGKFMYEFLDAV